MTNIRSEFFRLICRFVWVLLLEEEVCMGSLIDDLDLICLDFHWAPLLLELHESGDKTEYVTGSSNNTVEWLHVGALQLVLNHETDVFLCLLTVHNPEKLCP